MIRRIRPDEYSRSLEVVAASFDRFDAGYFSERGQNSFREYATYDRFRARQGNNYESFVYLSGDEIIAMMEIKNRDHISMLFVHPDHILNGCGRELVEYAVDYCRATRPFLKSVTVNSSPYAVGFYSKCGFVQNGQVNIVDELVSYPMRRDIREKKLNFSYFKRKYSV